MKLNDLITQLFLLRNERDHVRKQDKDLSAQIAELEPKIRELMADQGIDQTKIKGIGSVTSTEEVVAQVEDRDAFYAYLRDTGQLELTVLRPNNAAFRDYWKMGEEVPGVTPFTKPKLSVRKDS